MSGPSRPKPIARSIGLIFGGLWALIAAVAAPADWRMPLAGLAAVVTVFLIARLWHDPDPVGEGAERLFWRRAYLVAVGAEIVAIYGASYWLPRLGYESYGMQVIGIIVGLHFIRLWKATHSVRSWALRRRCVEHPPWLSPFQKPCMPITFAMFLRARRMPAYYGWVRDGRPGETLRHNDHI